MRKFRIQVNGKAYDVDVEEIGGGVSAPVISAPAPVVAAPAPAPAPAPAAQAAPAPAAAPSPAPASAPAGATVISSPMPGSIWKILVSVGDVVEYGQPVVVLEAMKMENDIVAPGAGTIASIHVKQGDAVDTGTLLVTIA